MFGLIAWKLAANLNQSFTVLKIVPLPVKSKAPVFSALKYKLTISNFNLDRQSIQMINTVMIFSLNTFKIQPKTLNYEMLLK